MNRKELLDNIRAKGSFLCVGLDTDIKRIPEHLLSEPDPIFAFNKAIIDATAPYCVAYKPNTAFYESMGVEGWQALDRTVAYLRENYPDQFVIADAKRGDIGNTSSLYARAFFEKMGVDALTVAPYMGFDSVKPFMDYEGHWVILLALTSNPGSRDFQFLTDMTGTRLFEQVIETARKWGNEDKLMFVVGATQGAMFSEVRRVAPDNFLLVPGVGAQGGSLDEVAKWGMTRECGLLVNSSRGIIYASFEKDFAEAAAAEARKLRDHMTILLSTHGVI
ncbi:MAG: orotidine-5'-phosphate decarboxylase [Muribaculaceae bacterium]|nr:orotidine-5'-phosphate decarboxylase [Muribaculaceae bacterium]